MERVVGFGEETAPGQEAVIRALDNCYDPCCRDRKISMVDMSLIESVEIQDREASIEMILTTGRRPFAARLLEMVKEEVAWDPTWTSERMSVGAREKLAPCRYR